MSAERAAWLKKRKLGIGSSDAPALHGKSPYLTEYECYIDKTTAVAKEKTNFIMNRGNEYEPKIRALFETYWNSQHSAKESLNPKNVALPNFPFVKASLDGISETYNFIIEIKYVSKEVYDSGLVPDHYWIQIQHQLLASQCAYAFYVCSTDGKEIKHIQVERDEEFILLHLQKCKDFWDRVTKKKPPPLSDKDYMELKGHDQLINHYTSLKLQLDTLERLVEMAKEKIISIVTHPRMKCGDVKIQKITAKGNVNYKDLLNEKHVASAIKRHKVDIESFRGSDKTFFKITTGNNEKG